MAKFHDEVWDALVSLDSETLLRVITDYHGMQIFDDGFAEHLVDEGFMEPEVIGQGQGDEEDED